MLFLNVSAKTTSILKNRSRIFETAGNLPDFLVRSNLSARAEKVNCCTIEILCLICPNNERAPESIFVLVNESAEPGSGTTVTVQLPLAKHRAKKYK